MCSCPSPIHNCFIYHRKIQGGLLSSVRTVSLGGLLCNLGGRSPNDTTSLCWDRISDRVEGAEQKQRAPEGIRPDLKATAKRLAPATGPISCRSKLCAGFVQPLALQTHSMNSSFFPFCCHKTRGAPYKMRVHISNHSWPRIKYYLMPVVKRIWTPSRLLKLNPQ